MLPKNKLDKLRMELKGHSLEDVAEKVGYSLSYLYGVLKGAYDNDKIIEACIEKRNEIRANTKKLADRI